MTTQADYTPSTAATDGEQLEFAINFPFQTKAQIKALHTPTGGSTVTLSPAVYTVAQNVAGSPDDGGTLTFLAGQAPAAGSLTIVLDIAANQTNPYGDKTLLDPQEIENSLDQQMLILKQFLFDNLQAVRKPAGEDPAIDVTLPAVAERALKFLAFNAIGNLIASAGPVGEIPVSTFMATVLDDENEAAALTTLGAMPAAPALLEIALLDLAEGDLLTVDDAGEIVKFALGDEGDVLTAGAAAPAWAAPATPEAAIPTGSVQHYAGATEPAGWLFLDGGTIGSGASGADRANADTEDLFTLLWNSMANAEAAVSGGRGASAAEDFAADKTLTLPDARGRTLFGKDDMGGSNAGRLTTGGSGLDGDTLGKAGGAETHTLTSGEMPSHSHSTSIKVPGGGASATIPTGSGNSNNAQTNSAGSGDAHNNVPPGLVLNTIIKL